MSKKVPRKSFEWRWNRFCQKVRFLCCCGCDIHQDEPREQIFRKIEIADQRRASF